jgi:hypothetical protein
MQIGVLSSGLMGGKLGTIFARAGHDVVFSYARYSGGLHLGRYSGLGRFDVLQPHFFGDNKTGTIPGSRLDNPNMSCA